MSQPSINKNLKSRHRRTTGLSLKAFVRAQDPVAAKSFFAGKRQARRGLPGAKKVKRT